MQIIEMLFRVKCEECGQRIKGEKFQGLGPGWTCQVCNRRIEEERDRKYEESNRKTAQQVIDRVKKDFRAKDIDEVLTILAEYGKKNHEKRDREFMRLAILRLANGDRQKVPGLVNLAKQDYRDVLLVIHREYGIHWVERFVSE